MSHSILIYSSQFEHKIAHLKVQNTVIINKTNDAEIKCVLNQFPQNNKKHPVTNQHEKITELERSCSVTEKMRVW